MDMEDKKHDTSFFSLENLQRFIEEKTADIILPVRTRTGRNEVKERPAAVYKIGTAGSGRRTTESAIHSG